jgi:hypothetical protein
MSKKGLVSFSEVGAFIHQCILSFFFFLLCNLLCMASVYRSKSNQGLERKGQNDVYYGQLRANKREENTIERHQNEISGNMNLISRKYCTLFFVFRLKY